MHRGPGRPPAKDIERKRRAVERIAEAAFARRGFRDTTIRQVAARARCSVGQIYKLYPSKQELFRAILQAKSQSLTDTLAQVFASDAPAEERLRTTLQAVLDFFQRNSAFFRIYALETGLSLWTGAGGRRQIEMIATWRKGLLDGMAEIVRSEQLAGTIRADLDPWEAAISLFGMMRAHSAEWILLRREGRLVDRTGSILEVFLRGVSAKGREEEGTE